MEPSQVVPRPALRLAVLRRVAQRLVEVVLDVHLREPDEDGGVPATEGGAVRSAWFVAQLAWKRLRRRDSGALVTVLGLAVATAVLAGVLAGVTIATDRSTAQAIERIPASERSARAVWFGIPGDTSERLAALDDAVAEAFAGFGLDGPTPLILFRESTVAGRFVGITAIDGVQEHVILRSGRLPRTCTAARCEVLRLRGRGTLPSAPGLRIVEVGTGTLRSRQLYGDFLLSSDAATEDATVPADLGETSEYHRPPPAPLVVAEGRAALASAAPLARTYRTYAWVWPMGPGEPRLWDLDALVAGSERARIELGERSSSFAVEAPVDELREIERAANAAGTRLLLVGGEGAALLLAFTILAARGMRRDLEAARRRLTWFGAQRWHLWLLSGLESSAVAVVGVVLGWIAGIALSGIVAKLAGAPVAGVLRESVLSPLGLGVAVATAVGAAVLVWVTVSLPRREGARVGVLDLVAAGTLLVVGVALIGGAADEDQLARGDGTALLLLLLPGLIAIAAALIVARVFPALARLAADRARRGLPARLAAIGLARGPGAAVATVAFLTIAFAVALLAEGYRATLVRADREQAAFDVPHDVVVREDLRNLVRVFDAAPLGRFDELVGGRRCRATGAAGHRSSRAGGAGQRRHGARARRRGHRRRRCVAGRVGGRAWTIRARVSRPARCGCRDARRPAPGRADRARGRPGHRVVRRHRSPRGRVVSAGGARRRAAGLVDDAARARRARVAPDPDRGRAAAQAHRGRRRRGSRLLRHRRLSGLSRQSCGSGSASAVRSFVPRGRVSACASP